MADEPTSDASTTASNSPSTVAAPQPVPTVMETPGQTAAGDANADDALRLVFVTGSKADTEFVFSGHALPFGRSIDDGLRFDPNLDGKVSGRHGQFRRDDRGTTWLVEDHGSTNGTFVNGERVVKPIALTHADTVILGDANDHGVIIRIAIGNQQLPPLQPPQAAQPETVAETYVQPSASMPSSYTPPSSDDDGGFFSGIKGRINRFTERRQLNKELTSLQAEVGSARAAAGAALQSLGVTLAEPDILGRSEFASLPAVAALNDAADETASLDGELAKLADDRAAAEAERDGALRDADAAVADAEKAAAEADAAKAAADEVHAAADKALREVLAPWKSAATQAKDAAATLLTKLQTNPLEADPAETAATLREVGEALDIVPDDLGDLRIAAQEATDAVTAAEDAVTAARGTLKQKQDARAEIDQKHRAALTDLDQHRAGIEGKKSALNAKLASHHVELAEAVVATMPPTFRTDPAWQAATSAVARRTTAEQTQADLEARLAELG
ncbi:MAG: FHA domain-containing protein [Planctomycetota bacterium]